MIIQIIMTESTGYLDMNKKKTFVIQIKPINSRLSFKKIFQAELDPSITFLLRKPHRLPAPKNQSQPIHGLLQPLAPEKIFHPCSQKKYFFSTLSGIRTHTFMILTARAQSAPWP